MICACALPDLLGSACDTAVMATVAGLGTCPGAVYTPEELIVPAVGLPPAEPLTCHVTEVFEDPLTVAVKRAVCTLPVVLTVTTANDGLTVTLICGAAAPPPQELKKTQTARLGTRNANGRMNASPEGGAAYVSMGVLCRQSFRFPFSYERKLPPIIIPGDSNQFCKAGIFRN